MTSAAIDIRGLSYSYADRPILKHLDFQVGEGEFFIIVGPNGSGKTTLLKTICGIEPAPKKSVALFGVFLSDYSKRSMARVLSFVPQVIPADFSFTVLETVLMGRFAHLGVLGVETEQDLEIAKRALTFSGVGHLSDRRINELSGGERQRVFIARALSQEPRLLVLDEPTASLDLAHQLRVMDLMEQLKLEKGLTIVMVSHDINLAAVYADRMLLMNKGQIVKLGSPWDVLTYQNLESVYQSTVLVDESPLGQYPRITLVPKKCLRQHAEKGHVVS